MPLTYAQVKARKESDPEYAARLKGYADKYKEKNLERERERQKEVKVKKRSNDRDAYNAYMREWSRKNKDSISLRLRTRLATDDEYAERIRSQARRRYAANPKQKRSTQLKTNYGITLDDYHKMYTEQNGQCAVCSENKTDNGRGGLVVDHCHESGAVRKLLCTHCNKGLGHFRDDVQRMVKAIEYLKLFQKE